MSIQLLSVATCIPQLLPKIDVIFDNIFSLLKSTKQKRLFFGLADHYKNTSECSIIKPVEQSKSPLLYVSTLNILEASHKQFFTFKENIAPNA